MRLQRKGNLKKARIEIIPMIDTIFFLLMISTLSMSRFTGVQVNLPKALRGPASDRNCRYLPHQG
jgi:biopolymer transport protein ExbD